MKQDKKTTDFGAMIGIILVIIVLLVGAFYFVNQRIEKQAAFQASIQKGISTSSDEIADIEASANSMNFDDLGSGINNL